MEKRIQEGPPIYIESLMTSKEVRERCKLYVSSHKTELRSLSEFDQNEMKWRWRMGEGLSGEEIILTNSRMDEIIRKAKIK